MLSSKWELKGKIDNGKLTCRARFVTREFKSWDPHRDDILAAATSVSTSRLIDFKAVRCGYMVWTLDVSSAFFHVPEDELCCVRPPGEWLSRQARQDWMWLLLRLLYGRRKGPQRWVQWAGNELEKLGIMRCAAAPYFFWDPVSDVCLEAHMDDFYMTGPTKEVEAVIAKLALVMKIKVEGPFGPGDSWSHLRRKRTWTSAGIMIMSDPRHVEKPVQLLDLGARNSKPVPVTKENLTETTANDKELNAQEAGIYRSGVGIVLYIAPDRADIQFAVSELTRLMKTPTERGMAILRRTIRYLAGKKGYSVMIPTATSEQENVDDDLMLYSDSNWAQDTRDRKSVSCGVIFCRGALLQTFVRRQTVIALSSGEAEWYAACSTVAEALHLRCLLDFGHPGSIWLYVDSTAAKGIGQRQGVGRLRHLATKTLWLQGLITEKKVKMRKVPGDENGPDIGTKAHDGPRLRYLVSLLGMKGDA